MHRLLHVAPPLLAAALTASLLSVPVGAFTDTSGSWAEPIIEKAAAYQLLGGYPDGSFGVGRLMTRAEFATVLVRMMGWAPQVPQVPSYFDCPTGFWGYSAIETAAAHNVSDQGGAFRPNDYISRAEMAEMLVRALGYQDLALTRNEASLPFEDVSNAKGYIAVAHDLGLINGSVDRGRPVYHPSLSAKREEAAAVLVRCYERLSDTTRWLHGFYAFSSYEQLDYGAQMDAVSAGWSRLEYGDGLVTLNQTTANGNHWVLPEGSELVTDRLAQAQVPLNLSVYANQADFASMIAANAQNQALGLLTDATAGYAGLTIDFEGLDDGQREHFTAFMTALRQALPSDKQLFVCVHPDSWFGGYDYRVLGQLCDRVILMAHDYQWASIPDYYVGTPSTYCPVSPLDQIYIALDHITDPVTGVSDTDRVALAISFNTTCFHVDEEGRLLDNVFYHPDKETIARRLAQADSLFFWDNPSHNPRLTYTNEAGEHYQLWYEDARSVSDKLQLARMFGVTGVSVWRLGAIPDSPGYDVWSTLAPDPNP